MMLTYLYYRMCRKSCSMVRVDKNIHKKQSKRGKQCRTRTRITPCITQKKSSAQTRTQTKNEIKRPGDQQSPLLLIILRNNRLVGSFAFASIVRMFAGLFIWVLLVSASGWDSLRGVCFAFRRNEKWENSRDKRKGGRKVCAGIGTKLPHFR